MIPRRLLRLMAAGGQLNVEAGRFGVPNHRSVQQTPFTKRPTSSTACDDPQIDVLDESGIRTGATMSRADIHLYGKVHRVVRLYLFNTAGELLLQRRTANVDHWPRMLSVSLAGHVDAGESSSAALEREIREELGLDAATMRIRFLFAFRDDARLSPTYVDRQFNDVYASLHDFKIDDLSFDKSAVSELKLVSFAEFLAMVASGKGDLAPAYAKDSVDVEYFMRAELASCVRSAARC